jgi:group II intron reverse transcriptase/maturase
MNAIYEGDFLGFSYGFRPGRSPHDALDALYVGIMTKPVSWVLDADIRGYFDAMDHEWLVRFVEHRIADKRVIRHIKKWLNAGVLEDGTRTQKEEGVPQGGSISPLLANIYLHYVFDLWADRWWRKCARGCVVVVRFADDFVVGFQYREDAERFWSELRGRFGKFNLKLQEDKTRLIEFGRYAAENRQRRGDGKPESFAFLGFLHVCDTTRKGKFIVLRQTLRKRMQAKLKGIKEELRRCLQNPIPAVGQWLRTVLLGHYRYFGVPCNLRKLEAIRYQISRLWYRTLCRRSQRHRLTPERMRRLVKKWLPLPRIVHSYPDFHLYVSTRGKSPVR